MWMLSYTCDIEYIVAWLYTKLLFFKVVCKCESTGDRLV